VYPSTYVSPPPAKLCLKWNPTSSVKSKLADRNMNRSEAFAQPLLKILPYTSGYTGGGRGGEGRSIYSKLFGGHPRIFIPPLRNRPLEWKLEAWLSAVSWWGFSLFGHEGSCHELRIRASTAVALAAYFGRLSFEGIRELLGKNKNNMSCFLGDLPSKPLFPQAIL
jgi:hypothetical protein